MRGTTQLLEALYAADRDGGSGNRYEPYAMTNAAKSSRADASTSAVLRPWLAELPALARDWLDSPAREYLRTVPLDGAEVPVVKTIHPSARAGQWHRFARTGLRPVAAMAKHLAVSAHEP